MFHGAAGASDMRGANQRMPPPSAQPSKAGASFAAQANGAAPHWRQCPPRAASHKSYGHAMPQGGSQPFAAPDPAGQPGASQSGSQSGPQSGAQANPGMAGLGGNYRAPTVEDYDEDDRGCEPGGATGEAPGEGAGSAAAADPFAPVGGSNRDGCGSGGSGGDGDADDEAPRVEGFDAAPRREVRSTTGTAPPASKRRHADAFEDEGYASDADAAGAIGLAGLKSHIARSVASGNDDEDDDDDDDRAIKRRKLGGAPGSANVSKDHARHGKSIGRMTDAGWGKKSDQSINEQDYIGADEAPPTEEDYVKYDHGAFENNVRLGNLAADAIDRELDPADVAQNNARLENMATGALAGGASEPMAVNNGTRDHLNPEHPAFAPLLRGISEANKVVQDIDDNEVFGKAAIQSARDSLRERFNAEPRLFREGSTSDNLMIPEFRIDCIERMKEGIFHVTDTVAIGGGEFFDCMDKYAHRAGKQNGEVHKLQEREIYQVQRLSPIIHILGETFEYYKQVADASLEGYEKYFDKMPIDPGTGKPISHYWLTPEGQFFKGWIAAFLDFDCALLGNFWRHTVMRGQSFKASWNQVINQILWCFGEETAAGSSGHDDRKNKSEQRIVNRSMKSKSVRQKDGMVPLMCGFDGGKGFDIKKHESQFKEATGLIREKYIKPSIERLLEEDRIRTKSDKNIYDRNDESTRDYVSHADAARIKAAKAALARAESEPDPEKRESMLDEAYARLSAEYAKSSADHEDEGISMDMDHMTAGDPAEHDGTGPYIGSGTGRMVPMSADNDDEGYYDD